MCFCCFCRCILPDFNRIENRWTNMVRALSDLMPDCETLQEAVYTNFGKYNS